MSSPSQTPSGAPPSPALSPIPAAGSPLAAFLTSPDFAAMLSGELQWGDIPVEPRETEVEPTTPPFRDFSALASGIPASLAFSSPNPRRWREMRAAEERPKSFIQQALDDEWDKANFAGPGCPFCDAIFSCNCWAQRAEAQEAEYRRQRRQERAEIAARIARGECACDKMTQHEDYPSLCEVCEREDELRCRDCGGLESCFAGCGDHGPEDEHESDGRTVLGDCSGCYPGCYGCDPMFDPSDPWGDGAPEEHPGHPAYDDYNY